MSTNDERSEQEPTSPQGCNDTDATAPHDCASHLYMNSAAVPGSHNGFSSDYWYQIRSFLLAGRGVGNLIWQHEVTFLGGSESGPFCTFPKTDLEQNRP